MVRGFARHLQALDPDTEIPPAGLLPHRCRRVAPYLYSDADIAALMAAARALPSPQRAATYETLVGLLAVTGMRIGEAVRLDRDHIDWDEGILTVWNSKFDKSRAVPLHPTHPRCSRALRPAARRVLSPPQDAELACCPRPAPGSTYGTIRHVFPDLVRNAGLEHACRRRPRPHDLRHSFAVRTLLGWYRAGVDVEAHMPLLSTYLGHSNPEDTLLVSVRRPRAAVPGR